MASAFDELDPHDAEYIRKRLLAGDTMAAIREALPGVTAYRMRLLRDEVFAALASNPDEVKALASGPMLNPLEVVRYTHSRKVIRRAVARQTEMFGEA